MMSAVTSTSTAVHTLARVDPDFVELVETLYGDAVDPEWVVSEFGKANPTQDDLARQKSERRQARIGLASNALGISAGTAALGEVARRPAFAQGGRVAQGISRAGNASGRLIPAAARRGLEAAGPKRLAAGALALQAANLGGDVVANRVLARSAKKTGDPVAKAVPIGAMVNGIRTKLGTATRNLGEGLIPQSTKPGGVPRPAPKPVPKQNMKAQAPWQQFGQGVGQAATSPPGKALIGAGVVAGGLKARSAAQRPGLVDTMSQQPVYKADDIEWAGTFSKFDDDKHLAFGWASVIKMNGLPVVDHQGDLIEEGELEDAAYKYVLESRKGGHMHRRTELDEPVHVSDIVESMVFTDEKIAKMGLPDSFPRGWWVGTKIHDPEVWSEVKKGNLAGFSIHGRGRRQAVSMDSAMGW